ncbi:MAG: hypothetical protein AMJ75_09705 [Phycisphaerae bacterium SM1_79]|nr:MAG: hypothetical protein AMJ75_09705 [Phycisphaerae bacterium SM1_79]
MSIAKRVIAIVSLLFGIIMFPDTASAQKNQGWWDNIEAQITVGKKEFLLGEPTFIRAAVTNHHGETIHLWDLIYRTFEFSAKDSSGNSVRKLPGPGLSGLFLSVPVAPTTSFDDVVFMNEHLDFPRPGVYRVTYRGSILAYEARSSGQHVSLQAIPVSGTVSVKLRQGSSSELEMALRQYLKQLRSDDRKQQRQAARALSASEPALAVKLLREALEAENGSYPPGATYAIWALPKIGTNEAIQALLNVAQHSNNTMVRIESIHKLGTWRIREAVPMLIDSLSDTRFEIRRAALSCLGSIGDKSCIREVESKFNDPDQRVRDLAQEVYKKLTRER